MVSKLSNVTHTPGVNKKIEPVKYLEKYILDQKVKKYVSVFFKKISVSAKTEELPPPYGVDRGNYIISNGKVRPVTYLWKGLFETKILAKIVLACDEY